MVIEVGDRFETKDSRDTGRVVEVIEALPANIDVDDRRYRAVRLANSWAMDVADVEEWLRQRETRFRIRTEVHPKNPSAVGRIITVREATLRTRYRKVSR